MHTNNYNKSNIQYSNMCRTNTTTNYSTVEQRVRTFARNAAATQLYFTRETEHSVVRVTEIASRRL